MRAVLPLLSLALLAALAAPAVAEASAAETTCHAALRARGVAFVAASRKGVELGVEVRGPVGGVELVHEGALVLDCSMVVSLVEAAPYLTALGLTRVTISSGYSRRNVRGTRRPSRHSFGLAVDVSALAGVEVGTLRVARDFEQGLGDDVDCLGTPATEGGALLKIVQCQLVRSGLFRVVLSPDYDDAHHDHFHLEALPWTRRDTLRAPTVAIH